MTIAKFTRTTTRKTAISPPNPPTWVDFFTANKDALTAELTELRQITAELTRRLSNALRKGDLDEARRLWDDGELVSQIGQVLRRPQTSPSK